MEVKNNSLSVIDAHKLMEHYLPPPPKFCVDTLLPHGLSILGGAPKVGKSWLVLDLCVRIAKGEPIWNLPTKQSAALYLCLEDSEKRVQQRLLTITDDVPEDSLFLATRCGKLADDLCQQIREQTAAHPDIRLVVVDTFQMVRGDAELNYASDYEVVRLLKQLADELNIALLLVHHLRKRGDSDALNKLSGTTGITGAADAVFVLDKSERLLDEARLVCTGRDIESRELKLLFDRADCVWKLVSDSIEQSSLLLPDELHALVELMKTRGSFTGSNTELACAVSSHSGTSVLAKGLKQLMNRWQSRLEREGVRFRSYRSNGQRMVVILFSPAVGGDASDGSDAGTADGAFSVPCVPCDPATPETEARL